MYVCTCIYIQVCTTCMYMYMHMCCIHVYRCVTSQWSSGNHLRSLQLPKEETLAQMQGVIHLICLLLDTPGAGMIPLTTAP